MGVSRLISWMAGAAVLCLAGAASAQQTAALGPSELPGARLERVLSAFKDAPPISEAAWDRSVCVGVSGVRDRRMQRLLQERIALRIYEAGLEAGRPNCVPNVLVFVTPEAQRMAQQLADEYRADRRFSAWMDEEALSAFTQASSPGRWWFAPPAGEAPEREREGVRTVDPFSRLAAPTTNADRHDEPPAEAFRRTLVVIDAAQAEGVSSAALGDFAAMAALAQLDQHTLSVDPASILKAFEAAETARVTEAMSEWDTQYVAARYRSGQSSSH